MARVIVRRAEAEFRFEAVVTTGSQTEKRERGRWAIDFWNPDDAGLRRALKRHYPNAEIVIEP